MRGTVWSFLLLLLAGLPPPARPDGYLLMPVELAPVPCNDRAVEKLSRLALTYINEDRSEGYKFALNRVANVHLHAQGPAGNVYYLDLDVLETKCHTGSSKPWKRCDVRPFMETQVSGNCNTTILHTPEGFSYLYSYDCALVPDPPEKLQQTCPTCPTLLSVDSPDAMTAAQLSLSTHQRAAVEELGVQKITRAAVQVRPVRAHLVEFTVQECPEGISPRGTCQRLTLLSDTPTAGFCTGSVYGDMTSDPEAQVSCEMFKAQNVDLVRPVLPQGHDFSFHQEPEVPTFSPPIEDPGKPPQTPPSAPPPPVDPAPVDLAPVDLAPVDLAPVDPSPFDPSLVDLLPVDPSPVNPSVVSNPSSPVSSSSSSESSESLEAPPPRPAGSNPLVSSSEEVLGLLALRPPLNFWYQRRDGRERRQAAAAEEATPPSPSHHPVFLADFPSGPSPFRSCPGPSRYTTV